MVNLKQRYSDFLGFKLKVCKKGTKWTVHSHVSDKAMKRAREELSACVRAMKRPPNEREQYRAIQKYNSVVAGLHNYYRLEQLMSAWTSTLSPFPSSASFTAG